MPNPKSDTTIRCPRCTTPAMCDAEDCRWGWTAEEAGYEVDPDKLNTTVPPVEVNDENVALARAALDGAVAERERIVAMIRAEADNQTADAMCWNLIALFVEANGSWYQVDELEAAHGKR
jgi:hypothetical protein